MQTLKVDYDYQVGVIGETSNLPRHEDIILTSMREKMGKIEPPCFEYSWLLSDMKMSWYSVF